MAATSPFGEQDATNPKKIVQRIACRIHFFRMRQLFRYTGLIIKKNDRVINMRSGVFDQHVSCQLFGRFGPDQAHDAFHFLRNLIDEVTNAIATFGGKTV